MEHTIEHRGRIAEIPRYFGADLVSQPHVPKRTALQDAPRQSVRWISWPAEAPVA